MALSWAQPPAVRASTGMWAAWAGLIMLALVAAFGFHAVGEPPGLAVSSENLWSGIWPLGIGLVAGALLQTVVPLRRLHIPPGDVLWALLALWRQGFGAIRSWLLNMDRPVKRLAKDLLAPVRRFYAVVTRVPPAPDSEPRWATAAIAFSLLAIMLMVTLGAQ